MAEGLKLDDDKPKVFQGVFRQFPNALRAVALLSEFGARKYSWSNWKDVPDLYNRYSDALGRHELSAASGETVDSETGMPHEVAVAWNALARLEDMLNGKDEKSDGGEPKGKAVSTEDRPRKESSKRYYVTGGTCPV